jgi:hypothetical protein
MTADSLNVGMHRSIYDFQDNHKYVVREVLTADREKHWNLCLLRF